MNCSACQAPVTGDSRFCDRCGHPVSTWHPPQPQPVQRKSGGCLAAALILPLLLAVLVGTGWGAWKLWPRISQVLQGTSGMDAFAGEWVLVPDDPLYDPSDPTHNRFALERTNGSLTGSPTEGVRFTLDKLNGRLLEGKAESEGEDTRAISLELAPSGERLTFRSGDRSATFMRPGGAATPPPPPPKPDPVPESPPEPVAGAAEILLFEDRGDVDADGREEHLVILSLDASRDPDRESPKRLEIRKPDGEVVFRQGFTTPFRTDFDSYADTPEGKAGVHVVDRGEAYPQIWLVFTPASGDSVVLQYTGWGYETVFLGD